MRLGAVRLFCRRFSSDIQSRQKGPTLELLCYPYLRDQLKTAERRGWVSTIYARVAVDETDPARFPLGSLANKFVDFKDFQTSYSALCASEKIRPTLSNIDIYFAPPANGRPAQFFDRLVQYDSKEYQSLVVPEMQGTPGDLFRLPALPHPIQQNLLAYFSHSDIISQGKPLKGVRFINYLFSGSTEYNFGNWLVDGSNSRELKPGSSALEATCGWRVLDDLKVHETFFMQENLNIHCGLYLGGRLVLHKLSSDGPLWISTFREIMELTGRWDKIHVRSQFTPSKLAAYASPSN